MLSEILWRELEIESLIPEQILTTNSLGSREFVFKLNSLTLLYLKVILDISFASLNAEASSKSISDPNFDNEEFSCISFKIETPSGRTTIRNGNSRSSVLVWF